MRVQMNILKSPLNSNATHAKGLTIAQTPPLSKRKPGGAVIF